MKKPYAGDTELFHGQCIHVQSPLRQVSPRKKLTTDYGTDVTHQLMVKQREMMAHEFEQYYADRGFLVEVELSGHGKTCISLFSSLFCEDSVYRIAEKTNLFFYLRKAGFKKATLGDSDERTWVYNLKTPQ